MSGSQVSAHLPRDGYARLFNASPTPLLAIRAADLRMVAATDAFLASVGLDRDEVVGRRLFDVFPDSPLHPEDQTSTVRALIDRGLRTGEVQGEDGLRYDLADGAGGFTRRWWKLRQVPVPAVPGRVEMLLLHSEDVTGLRQTRRSLRSLERGQEEMSRRLERLAGVALALTSADSLADLEEIVVHRGTRVLGADGGSVLTRAADGGWRNTLNPALTEQVRERYQHLPFDSPLPGPHAARTGERVLLPTRAEGRAWHPVMTQVQADRQRLAWAALPLVIQGEVLGALTVSWLDEHEFTAADLEMLEAFAAQCAQALSRIQAAEARARTARRVQDLAESLQRSMLTPPPRPTAMDIAVRYRSAIDVAQVGGDWYDAFVLRDGATMVSIGDVCGHDDVAAGKMGQLRGLLRALAYDSQDRALGHSPAAILTRFEYAAAGLHVDELATAILARVETVTDEDGTHLTVRWSNAGNPPPVLVDPAGRTTVLEVRPDLILGVDPDCERHDHVVDLPHGSTLLLYTDGLIERRGVSIDTGIGELCRVLGEQADQSLETLCDRTLARLEAHLGEDDVALLAVRAATSAQPARASGAATGVVAAFR